MRVYITLGKIGDALISLPLAQHYFATTGTKPAFMIAEEYAHLLDRAPGVRAYRYQNGWQDLSGALWAAKQNFSSVVTPQVFGNGFPIQKRRSSFQLDVWDRAGALPLWDTLPLKLEPDRAAPDLPKINMPFVLLADHSQSSPFPEKEDLADSIRQYLLKHPRFHLLIRLSEIRLQNFVDFLALYDRAAALVTIETAHLHLSRASPVPTFALATDKPSRWHGSAWSSRFRFYCRYSEYPSRKAELLHQLGQVLDGVKPFPIVKV